MRLGAHVIHLALAIVLALRVASGWGVPAATFVIWVALLLLSAMLDGIGRARARTGDEVPATDVADEGSEAGRTAPAWSVTASHAVLPECDPPDDGRREWRRHLADVDIRFEERYPREGICTTCDFFLRAGDVLALRYFPVREEGVGHWHCDLVGPQGLCTDLRVSAAVETRVPIEQTGVYSIGVGQGESGLVGLWLLVPGPEALSLPVEPAQGSSVRFETAEDGSPRVRTERDEPLQTHGALPRWTVYRPAASSALLFTAPGDAWDAGPMPMPSLRQWREPFFHVSHYFLKLCRGDVLALEYVWQEGELGQMFDLGDGARSGASASLVLKKFVRGPSVMWVHEGMKAGMVSAVCPDDGFYTLEFEVYGPAAWRERPLEAFLRFRLWGEFLQRPGSIRDFELHDGWIEEWYRQRMPVPRAAIAMEDGRCSQR